jgi:Type IV secretion system pilin
MKKIKSFAKEFGVSILTFALPVLASAQTIPVPTAPVNPGAPPQGHISSLQGVLNTVCIVFDWAFYFLVALAVIFIIVAAFKYLTAAGEPEKVKGAGNTLLYAAVAVGVALLARAVPLIVASFLGASGLTTC